MRYPELRDIETWISADEARRRSIAEEIATEHGLALERLDTFRRTDLPLASFRGLDGLFRFVLVPGGTYDRGCSDTELSLLEARALPFRPATDSPEDRDAFEQEWGTLFELVDTMRPVDPCTVPPLLAAQTPVGDFSPRNWRTEIGQFFVGEHGDTKVLPAEMEAGLEMFGYRLPTEREWEWLARGGRRGELTYRGSEIGLWSDHRERVSAHLREAEGKDQGDRHAAISNDFGLTAFGLLPELCRDRYASSLAAPFETTPKLSERTVRGGGGVAFGQGRGEWHSFLTAHRQPGRRLASEPGLRLVRDVEPR